MHVCEREREEIVNTVVSKCYVRLNSVSVSTSVTVVTDCVDVLGFKIFAGIQKEKKSYAVQPILFHTNFLNGQKIRTHSVFDEEDSQ